MADEKKVGETTPVVEEKPPGTEGAVHDPAYGDPPYPSMEEPPAESQPGDTQVAPDAKTGEKKPVVEPDKATETEVAGEAEEKLPEGFGTEDYLDKAFGGAPTDEKAAAALKAQRLALSRKGTEDAALRQEIQGLRTEVAQLREGADVPTDLSLDDMEDKAEALTKQQLGERPDSDEDPMAASKWDRRVGSNYQDIRDRQKGSVESRERDSLEMMGHFLATRFPNPGIRQLFMDTVNPALEGIEAHQLNPALYDLLARGFALDAVAAEAFLDGRRSILAPAEEARETGTPIVAQEGAGKAPEQAAGMTEEELLKAADEGKITPKEYYDHLKKLKDAGLA